MKQSGCPNLAVRPNIPDFTLIIFWMQFYGNMITAALIYADVPPFRQSY